MEHYWKNDWSPPNIEPRRSWLISQERISNESAVIVAKGADAFLLLNYVLEQLEYFLPPWCMVIDSNYVNHRD